MPTSNSQNKKNAKLLIIVFTTVAALIAVPLIVYFSIHKHSLVTHEAKDPTCLDVGWKEYETCQECDYTTYQEIPALGHDYDEASYVWSDDYNKCTATRVCKRDSSHTETLNGSISTSSVNATCLEKGAKTYLATFEEDWCSNQTRTITIDALGHEYGEVTYTWNDDHSECTAKQVCLRNEEHVLTATTNNITSSTTLEATCTVHGTKLYTAIFEESWASAQTQEERIAPLGHNYAGETAGSLCTRCHDYKPSENLAFIGDSRTTKYTTVVYYSDGTSSVGDLDSSHDMGDVIDIQSIEEVKSYAVNGIGECADTDIYIPSEHNGLEVTQINALQSSDVTSIYVPDTVTSIEASAFSGNGNMTSVRLSNNITNIGLNTFANCTSLKSITIPEGVTSIQNYAFGNCPSLTSVVLPKSLITNGLASMAFKLKNNSTCNLKTIYFHGRKEEQQCTIYPINVNYAEIVYYSETKPTDGSKAWYFDANGNIVVYATD